VSTTSEEPNQAEASHHGLLPVASAVAAGVGTLGWVTFLGGALLWIGFREAGLAPAEAVAKVPTGVLVATGAEFVAVAAVVVAATVILLYFVDGRMQRWADRGRMQLRKEVRAELGQQKAEEERAAGEKREKWQIVEQKREAVEVDLASRSPRWDDPGVAASEEQLSEARADHDQASEKQQTSEQKLREKAKQEAEMSSLSGRELTRRFSIGALVAVAAIGLAWAVDLGHGPLPIRGWLWVSVSAVFSGLVGVILYTRPESAPNIPDDGTGDDFARGRYRFPVIGLVVFIAVPVTMAVGIYFRAEEAPRVKPLALLQADGSPLVGFFVAETSDRVFAGTFERRTPDVIAVASSARAKTGQAVQTAAVERTDIPPRMLSLPRDQVRNVTIGPPLPLNADDLRDEDRSQATTGDAPRTAREWATGAALILCEQANRTAAARPKRGSKASGTQSRPVSENSVPPPGCSTEAIKDIRTVATDEKTAIEGER